MVGNVSGHYITVGLLSLISKFGELSEINLGKVIVISCTRIGYVTENFGLTQKGHAISPILVSSHMTMSYFGLFLFVSTYFCFQKYI